MTMVKIVVVVLALIYALYLYRKSLDFFSVYWIGIFILSFVIPKLSTQIDTYGYHVSPGSFQLLDTYYVYYILIYLYANIVTKKYLTRYTANGLLANVTGKEPFEFRQSVLVFAMFVLFAILLLAFRGLSGFTRGSSKAMQDGREVLNFMVPTVLFGLVSASLLMLLLSPTSRLRILSFFFVVVSFFIGIVLTFARRTIIYPFIAFVVYYMYLKRKKISVWILVMIAGILTLVVLPMMVSIRTFGVTEGIVAYIDNIFQNPRNAVTYLTMSTDFSWSYGMAAVVITNNIRIPLISLLRPFTMVIPRSIWSSKPLPPSLQLVHILGLSSGDELSIPAGPVGEAFIYGGFICLVCFALVWGVLTAMSDRKLEQHSMNNSSKVQLTPLMITLAGTQIIAGSLRGDTSTTLQETIIVVLPFVIVVLFVNFITRRLKSVLEKR